MTSRLVTVGRGARDTVAATVVRVRRISAGPALVRVIAAVAAFASLILALPVSSQLSLAPPSVVLRIAVAVLLVAGGVGVCPRTRWVSLTMLAAVLVWLVSTIGLGEPVGLLRVAALAVALYLTHAAAAFAAVLPYDCLVTTGVLLRWLRRVGAVLGVSVVLGVGGMAVVGLLPSARSAVGPVVGSVIAAGLVGLLAWHLRRGRG